MTISLFGYQLVELSKNFSKKITYYEKKYKGYDVLIYISDSYLNNINSTRINLLNTLNNYNGKSIVLVITNNENLFFIKDDKLLVSNEFIKNSDIVYSASINNNSDRLFMFGYIKLGKIDEHKLSLIERKICDNSSLSNNINEGKLLMFYIINEVSTDKVYFLSIDVCNLI
jgi:hypothetical protein